jgi:histidinol phosphatase-like PHP family hydrolase
MELSTPYTHNNNKMKIDLHVHSQERSACGKASEEEQIRAAIAAGLDAIAFTDHHRLVPLDRLAALNQQFAPFRVFGGIEISSQGEDFLVLGLHHPALESPSWSYPDLHTYVRQQGGYIAMAHPFRFRTTIELNLDGFVPDALEVRSFNTPLEEEARIREIASRLGVPVLCNSDAHTCERIGMYYNLLEEFPADDKELITELKSGRFRCMNGRIL